MLERLNAWTSEARAFARQAWLLRHDAARPVVPEAEGDVVVFLHGIFATAGVLRPLRAAVTRHRGVHAAAISYAPGPGIDHLAARLGELVAQLSPNARIHLVGHSLGGIVVRHFAHLADDARIVQTISLASPFAGVPRLGLLGVGFARDLDPASPLLRRLRLDAEVFAHIPHLSVIAGDDQLTKPPVAQALPFGDVAVFEGIGHNGLLFDADVARLVSDRVLDPKYTPPRR